MENWDKLEHDFGVNKAGIILTTSFNFQGDKEIKEIEPTCNCVSYKWASNVLRIQWKVRNYTRDTLSIKNILVLYEDGSFDDLTLKAHIKV
jgi:hypothetical protein